MAASIKGTKQSDSYLLGTNGSDKIQGKGGKDVIFGNLGNDDIDGGKGSDHNFLIKDTGNDKIIVTDSVAGRDGSDSLKHVEALRFDDATIRLDQNSAAVTRADTVAADEDNSVVLDVLGNDVDFEGNALTITQIDGQDINVGGSVVLESGAIVTLNANQTLTYDPAGAFQSLNGGEQGADGFVYTVADSQGAISNPTAVNVTVNGVWETPTYIANGFPDESAQKPDTNGNPLDDQMLVGSGIPAKDFGLVRAEDAGIELGLQVIYRQAPTVITTDDYADGVLRFAVNDGPQSTVNGSFQNAANRTA